MSKKIFFNIFSSASQAILIGFTYFFLYKFLLKHLGVEVLGVWSVVMATSSIANVANFGVATSVVRFVALYIKEGSEYQINKLIFTSALFIFVLFALLSVVILPFADILLTHVIEKKYLSTALGILPYSLICLILNAVAGVFASVLDGLQKNYIRSIIFAVSSLVLLSLTHILLPNYNLLGVVFAQLCQSFFTILCCLISVVIFTKYNPLKWQWDKKIFKEIFAYGIKFQFISISSMFNEPVTKLFLAKYGGLQFTGYYEMANKLIMQVRGVIVNANQSLIPLMVKSNSEIRQNDSNHKIYSLSFLGVSAISIFLLTLPLLNSGLIAQIWIGQYKPIFDQILFLTGVSMYFNLLCTPAYFALLAEGNLNPVMISQIIIALCNVIFGYLLGYLHGGIGVVYGWIIATSLGTIYLLYTYNKENVISLKSIFRKEVIFILMGTSVVLCLKYSFPQYFSQNTVGQLSLTLLIYLFFIYHIIIFLKSIKSGKIIF